MTKKIFALVMVIGLIGGVLGGCSPPAEEKKETTTTTTGDAAKTEETK